MQEGEGEGRAEVGEEDGERKGAAEMNQPAVACF